MSMRRRERNSFTTNVGERKQQRKQARKLKKINRQEHFKRKSAKEVLPDETEIKDNTSSDVKKRVRFSETCKKPTLSGKIGKAVEEKRARFEKKLRIQSSSRKIGLKEANQQEDIEIHRLETLLKIKKRKKTSKLPKFFEDDGLDYILDVTEPGGVQEADLADMTMCDVDFDDDDDNNGDDVEEQGCQEEPSNSVGSSGPGSASLPGSDGGDDEEQSSGCDGDSDGSDGDDDDASDGDDAEDAEEHSQETPGEVCQQMKQSPCPGKTRNKQGLWQDIYGRFRDKQGSIVQPSAIDDTGTSADSTARYIPPALRARSMAVSSQRQNQLKELRRQLLGQLNRLAAGSMRHVTQLVREMYLRHSRHDVTDTLTHLVHQVCAPCASVSSSRLIAEHAVLLAALHNIVGSEVGAHFLQKTAQTVDTLLKQGMDVSCNDVVLQHESTCCTRQEQVHISDKRLENLLILISYLYCFQVCDDTLVCDLVQRLTTPHLPPHHAPLLVALLRCSGPSMRRRQPLQLKTLLQLIQRQSADQPSQQDLVTSSVTSAEGSTVAASGHVGFMMDVLMALKNNNLDRIPQYDPQLETTMMQLLKSVVSSNITTGHKNSCDLSTNQLSIGFQDLVNAEEKGKWWLIGSAWSCDNKQQQQQQQQQDREQCESSSFSQHLLQLAARHRMNTDLRRTVFCVVVSAEDYRDAFDKLTRVKVSGVQQQRHLVAVVVECCLREGGYNAYYGHLLAALCHNDRRRQMCVRVCMEERLCELGRMTGRGVTNLTRLLAQLIITGHLNLAILQSLDLYQMNAEKARMLRRLFLLLLDQSSTSSTSSLSEQERFDKIRVIFSRPRAEGLSALRDALILFLRQFVSSASNVEDKSEFLRQAVEVAVQCLRQCSRQHQEALF